MNKAKELLIRRAQQVTNFIITVSYYSILMGDLTIEVVHKQRKQKNKNNNNNTNKSFTFSENTRFFFSFRHVYLAAIFIPMSFSLLFFDIPSSNPCHHHKYRLDHGDPKNNRHIFIHHNLFVRSSSTNPQGPRYFRKQRQP